MSTILLIVLFLSLCLLQWSFSQNKIAFLSFLPMGLYLLIVGIAVVRTIVDGTFSAEAAILLLIAFAALILIDRLSRFLHQKHTISQKSQQLKTIA